jgi:hypothetical protein
MHAAKGPTEVWRHLILISELDGCDWSVSSPRQLTPNWMTTEAEREFWKQKTSCNYRESNHDSSVVQLVV